MILTHLVFFEFIPGIGDGATTTTETPRNLGGYIEYQYPKRKKKRSEPVSETIAEAVRALKSQAETVEEQTGVAVLPAETLQEIVSQPADIQPVAAAVLDRLSNLLAEDAPDYLTPIEAARQLIIELIAEQNRLDEDEEDVMLILMAMDS